METRGKGSISFSSKQATWRAGLYLWDSNLKEIEPHQRSNLQAQPKLMGTGEETVSLMGEKAKFNWTLMRWWRTKDMVTNPRWCLWRRTSTCRPSSSSPSLQSTQWCKPGPLWGPSGLFSNFLLNAHIFCSTVFFQVCLVWERLHQQYVPQDDHEQAYLLHRHWQHCEFRQE